MAQKLDIKDFVAKENYVDFESYRQGVFYYKVYKLNSTISYMFPVPLDDIGTATLLATDKSVLYMRWIRKAIEDGTFIKYK